MITEKAAVHQRSQMCITKRILEEAIHEKEIAWLKRCKKYKRTNPK